MLKGTNGISVNELVEALVYAYGITEEEIRKNCVHEGGSYSSTKELIGDRAIKESRLWSTLFPNYRACKKNRNVKMQKDGVDYIIVTDDGEVLFIDLKSIVGDYTWKGDETTEPVIDPADHKFYLRAPIEIRQNGNFTNLSKKRTTHLLYIWHQIDGKVYYSLVDYQAVVDISKKVDATVCKNTGKVQDTRYKHFTSNNGSGEYILFPLEAKLLGEFTIQPSCYLDEGRLNDLLKEVEART